MTSEEYRKPNWFDWIVYRLFYWRWNPILRENPKIRALFYGYYEAWRDAPLPSYFDDAPMNDDGEWKTREQEQGSA